MTGRSILGALALGLVMLWGALASPAQASVSQVGNCKIKPYTSCPGADLSFQDLSGADLLGADLTGADLSWSNLSGAHLEYAKLSGANIIGTNFSSAGLEHANLSNVTGNAANFHNVRAHDTRMTNAYLYYANLSGGHFWRTNFDNALLQSSDLSYAELRNMSAIGADFSHTQMHHSQPSGSNFENASFFRANLADTMWFQSKIKNANFHQAQFSNTSFPSALYIGTAHIFPSNLASDHVARHYFFMPVHASVLAYSSHGRCQDSGSGAHVDCQGTNNAHDATYPFQRAANFGWGSTRSDGMRGFYIQGGDNIKLEGVASPNLGAFHVQAAYNWPEVSGTMNVAGAGEVGGPLAQNITYSREFSGSGYSDHFSGWLRRNLAPSGH